MARVELRAPGQPCVAIAAADPSGGEQPVETMIEVGVAPGVERGVVPVPQPLRLHVYLWSDRTLIAGMQRSLQPDP